MNLLAPLYLFLGLMFAALAAIYWSRIFRGARHGFRTTGIAWAVFFLAASTATAAALFITLAAEVWA